MSATQRGHARRLAPASRLAGRRRDLRSAVPPEEDDRFASLLSEARGGDPGAWSQLYHDVAPLVLGYLRGQRLDDAEDVAGEVMLEMVRGIDRFEGTRQQFRSWVLTIAHHRMIDQRRRSVRRPSVPTPTEELEPEPGTEDPAAEVLAASGLADLEVHLAALTDEQRTVILLRVVAERSLKEVAEITGRQVNAVKAMQHRAIAALRRRLEAGEAADAPHPTGATTRISMSPDDADPHT